MPRHSVVIPTHDRLALLREALASLEAQTLGDWEAVVVDDASEEDIASVDGAAGGRVRVVACEGRGAPAARNTGARHAAGELVTFLDSDDLLPPDSLARRAAYHDTHPGLAFAAFQCEVFRDAPPPPGDVRRCWNTFTPHHTHPEFDDLDRYLAHDVVWQTTGPTWRRDALLAFDPWDEDAPSGQDWEFHARALAAGLPYAKVDEVASYWRLPSGDRGSINRAMFDHRTAAAHARAWPRTVRRVLDAVSAAGEMTDRRRLLGVGLLWKATEKLAHRGSFAEARVLWRELADAGYLDARRKWEGLAYLRTHRIPAYNRFKRRYVQRHWPELVTLPASPTYGRAPLPGDPPPPPRVSVVMAVYNGEGYLTEAIASVRGQTFRDFEFIIIDDGSTDDTPRILAAAAREDCRVRLISRENRGLVASLNEGVAAAAGALIARMDADDVCEPDRLTRQVAFLDEHPEVVLLGGQVQDVDPLGLPLHYYDLPTDHDVIDAELLAGKGGTIRHPAAVFRRGAFDAVGGYDPAAVHNEDLDLWLKLAEVGRVANLGGDPVLRYRQHPASINRTRADTQATSNERSVRLAHERRGLPDPGYRHPRPTPEPAAELLHRWAWRAIKSGERDAAVRHARRLVRARPLSWSSWTTLRCARRGR